MGDVRLRASRHPQTVYLWFFPDFGVAIGCPIPSMEDSTMGRIEDDSDFHRAVVRFGFALRGSRFHGFRGGLPKSNRRKFKIISN
jgi:hypothetical protein